MNYPDLLKKDAKANLGQTFRQSNESSSICSQGLQEFEGASQDIAFGCISTNR